MGEALEKASLAKAASYQLAVLGSDVRNKALANMAARLVEHTADIMAANDADM